VALYGQGFSLEGGRWQVMDLLMRASGLKYGNAISQGQNYSILREHLLPSFFKGLDKTLPLSA
jgi:hypothetical protein